MGIFGGRVWFCVFDNGRKWDLLFDEEAGMCRGASGEHRRSIVGASVEHAGSMQGAYWGV